MNEKFIQNMEDDFEIKEEYDFSSGIRGRFYKPQKTNTNIKFDDDIILYFKKLASEKKMGYQTLMNLALREYIHNSLR